MMIEFNNLYEKGDTVIFEKQGKLLLGIITGYSIDTFAGNSIWYDIAVGEDCVFTYTTGGDIHENDIICKITDQQVIDKVVNFVNG